MKNVDAHIKLYADDLSCDVWEEYCEICKVSTNANVIYIGFDYLNVDEIVECCCCGEEMKEEEAKYVTFEDGSDYICSKCLEDFGKCEACGVYFRREDLYAHTGGVVCEDCYDEAEEWR